MSANSPHALVADIGGTHARFALADVYTRELHVIRKFKVSDFGSLEAAAAGYLTAISERPAAACFAIAGPVGDEPIRLTNANWSFSRAALAASIGIDSVVVVNDFEALAHGLPHLGGTDVLQIGGEQTREQATKAVVGPGTGLGVAGLVWSPTGWRSVSGEGGHVTFAAETAEEFSILERLRSQFGHVSAERLLSGAGLADLYRILRDLDGRVSAGLTAPEVVAHAAASDDPFAVKAVELFAGWLGRFAGDVALMFGAQGGVYIAGGIPPRILDVLTAGHFRAGFNSKGRMTDYLRRIPVYVIVTDDAGLRGAAAVLCNRRGLTGINTATISHS